MKGNHNRRPLALTALLGLAVFGASAQAEDIEVFFTKQSNNVAPNVLFVLDSSGSMNEKSGELSRMDILKNSLHQVLKPEEPYKALNVGIMDFGGWRSGGIDFPVTDINSDASLVDSGIPAGTDVGTVLDFITKSYSASGKTPMGDALYFSSSYFSGKSIFNTGWRGRPGSWDSVTNTYSGGSRYADNPASYEGGSFQTWTWTEEYTRRRWCSPGGPNPNGDTSCDQVSGTLEGCYDVAERPGSCRIQQNNRTCDSTGLECSDNWQTISTVPYDGSNRPADPDGSGNAFRVHCDNPRPAYRYCVKTETASREHTRSDFDQVPNYKSPITHRCQSNYVVMLTDGEPTRRDTLHYIASRVSPITGSNDYHDCDELNGFNDNIRDYGRCLPELVEYMARYDQAPDLDGKQSVYTYTIGFKLSGNQDAQNFLKLLAEKSKGLPSDGGAGEYFNADSPEQLVAVFKKIIKEVTGTDVSFVSPSVNVDQANRLSTSKYLYRPEFTPSDKPRWSGDIIKTMIDPDSITGFTDSPDTLAKSLVANQRKIVTLTGGNPDLGAAENLFMTGNDSLKALLRLTTTLDLDKLILWTRGVDVQDENKDGDNTDERQHLGDSLHTAPIMVNYIAGAQQVLYATTNEGMLHAFDVSGTTPKELFAFIPPELLPKLDILYRNNNNDAKVYGLDGDMTVWQDASHVYLYFGMRRGGSNYYALDISNPQQPKWLWTIKGGTGDFAELGQTWSTPQLTKVMSGGTETMALVFAGGYDTNQDDTQKTVRSNDNIGRAIFIVDARTGKKIWSAGPDDTFDIALGEMKNSIPSDARIIDLDGNGLADRLYVGDTGGRVWRIDIDQSDVSKSSGYLLADFNDGTAVGNRRFYYPPSVAFDRRHRLMVAIGSGYRAHPTETTTEDRFYVFQDQDAEIGKPRTARNAVTEADLGDITNELALTANKPGWYIRLEAREKVLAESIIFNGKVVFTSYQPNFQENNDTCNLKGNTPRVRMLALEDGRPVTGLGGNPRGKFTVNDRLKVLETVQFIPGAPYITFNKPDTGNQNGAPPIGGDSQTADLYVGRDKVDTDSFLTDRISWQNR